MAQRPANIDEADWNAVNNELARIGANGSGGVPLEKLISAKPEDLGNDGNLELLWAEKAFKHAETYFKILQIMPNKAKIKLTQSGEIQHTCGWRRRTAAGGVRGKSAKTLWGSIFTDAQPPTNHKTITDTIPNAAKIRMKRLASLM